MHLHDKKIFLYSLGCAKNLVDGEFMSALLKEDHFRLTADPAEAAIIIVNTCGFIESAKEESIAAILDMADYKTEGSCEMLIVTGCLSERYAEDMKESIPEADAILGVHNYKDIVDVIHCFYEAENKDSGDKNGPIVRTEGERGDVLAHTENVDRMPSTDYYAYLKIAEGCSNHCAFCAIPAIRGPFRSRKKEDILAEARSLIFKGYDELIVIAQDSGFYGLDLYGKRVLAALLRALCQFYGLKGIRVPYLYAAGLSDELLAVFAEEEKLVPYFDIPIQHASDKMLRAMDRSETQEGLRNTFRKIRKRLPGAVLRSTVMVGYPGETEEDFEELIDFIREIKFDMLGCFIFSPEEGTRAASLGRQLPLETKEERYDKLMLVQQELSHENLHRFVGRTLEVKLEDISPDGLYYLGRSAFQAPEVDSSILVLNQKEEEPVIGSYVDVKILAAEAYELTGIIV